MGGMLIIFYDVYSLLCVWYRDLLMVENSSGLLEYRRHDCQYHSYFRDKSHFQHPAVGMTLVRRKFTHETFSLPFEHDRRLRCC